MQKTETPQEIIERLNIDSSQSSEKFQHLSNEILVFLIKNLRALDSLEKEIYERSLDLKNPKEPNQVQPGEKELWKEYTMRYREITSLICIKPNDWRGRSFGNRPKYDYLNYPDTRLLFIMKSAKRAVVETYFNYAVKEKEQFILKKDGDHWKIDVKKHGFQSEEKWYTVKFL
ncbi:hypothetical protein [Winogradskyella luteola]|uniref:NTF2 fold immunity protein domain-containing protein n=1 Tax=Winogradskyella luteola TaxID=2828330 RepID=A0A9X1JTH2_9FLAO|nr:hypothetical protein [Winogradskyella luteola]MBV7270622.1 hypothetical protein [Winogradskyella luteola]